MNQSELFGARQQLPNGLIYRSDFIDQGEEQALVAAIKQLPLRQARFQQYTARRRVVRFGEGDYLDSEPDQETDFPRVAFPSFLLAVRERVAAWLDIPAAKIEHGLVTEYAPGTPIGWHRDAPHFETVAGISLCSTCRMRFRPYDDQSRDATVALELQPRSLYVMRDDIRWRWQHSIPPVKQTRYSITMRTLVDGPQTHSRSRRGGQAHSVY